jgi:hypothetical protein
MLLALGKVLDHEMRELSAGKAIPIEQMAYEVGKVSARTVTTPSFKKPHLPVIRVH